MKKNKLKKLITDIFVKHKLSKSMKFEQMTHGAPPVTVAAENDKRKGSIIFKQRL